jgi:hypothetical protein
MLAVVASQLEQNPTLEAFREEASFITLDANRNANSLFDVLKGYSELKLIAADHGSVATVEELYGLLGRPLENLEKLHDRARQYALIDIPHRLIRTPAELDGALDEYGHALTLRPRRIGAMDRQLVYRGGDNAAIGLLLQASEFVACPFLPSPRFVVDTVSLGGRHVTSDVACLRVDERGGGLHVRHRISLLDGDPRAIAAEAAARQGLDALAFCDGASQVELVQNGGEWRICEIRSAPQMDGAGADASFTAFGCSHAHLYCESILRPSEFERRFSRPPRRRRYHLASAPIRRWTDPQSEGRNGLRLLRRLTGYHSINRMSLRGQGGVEYVVSLVHEDMASLENSLKIIHEMEDSGSLFGADGNFIAYAMPRRGQTW